MNKIFKKFTSATFLVAILLANVPNNIANAKSLNFDIEKISDDLVIEKSIANTKRIGFRSIDNENTITTITKLVDNEDDIDFQYKINIPKGGKIEVPVDPDGYSDGSYIIKDSSLNTIGIVSDIEFTDNSGKEIKSAVDVNENGVID